MSDTPELMTALAAENPEMVLAACWDAVSAAGRAADTATWQGGNDELAAMAAAEECAAARELLPRPSVPRAAPRSPGAPRSVPEPMASYADLLTTTAAALDRVADANGDGDLVLAAQHVRRAADVLLGVEVA